MSLLYSKLRLQIPQISDGKNAIITSPRGVNRSVPMTYPLTDVFVGGMDKYTVQAGTTSESFAIGNGKLKKIVTEDASALTVASPPTKTSYLVGENLDLTGAVINATIQKGNGTSETRNVTSIATYNPPNGTQLNTSGSQRVNVGYANVSTYFDVQISIRQLFEAIPYNFYWGGAVIYNGEIHILGGEESKRNHYKWNGTSWESVSTLPFDFYRGSATVGFGCIHIFGGSSHYAWDGTSWTQYANVSGLDLSSAVELDGYIHLLGGQSSPTRHTKYTANNTTQSAVSIPYDFFGGGATVQNGNIYIMGSASGSNANIYNFDVFDGSSWTKLSSDSLTYGCLVSLNNEIHALGGDGTYTRHKKWNGTSWVTVSTLPFRFYKGSALVYNTGASDEIILLGSAYTGNQNKVAQWDGSTWTVAT